MFGKSNSKNEGVWTRGGNRLHSVAGVAEVYGISKRSVWRLIARGDLKPVRLGRAVRIRSDEMDALVARGGTNP